MNRTELIETLVVRVAPEQQQRLRKILELKKLEEIERLHDEVVLEDADIKLAEIQGEREANRLWHQYETNRAREPEREAQLEQDRTTFIDAARTLRSFGLTQANFNVTLQTL